MLIASLLKYSSSPKLLLKMLLGFIFPLVGSCAKGCILKGLQFCYRLMKQKKENYEGERPLPNTSSSKLNSRMEKTSLSLLFCFQTFFFPGNTLSFTLFSGVLHGSHCSASWQALLSIVFLISVSLITLKQNNYIRNRLKQITEAILHLTPKYLQQ